MTKKARTRVVALEEHYQDPELASHYAPGDGTRNAEIVARLEDLGETRLKSMDAAGVDLQVLSHAQPATQKLDAEAAVRLARETNDRLHRSIQANPDRFAAFGILPTPDPKAAADELERVVTRLGFKGAMIHGLTHGRFIDEREFWPILERAQALDVPIYLHPGKPAETVIDAYYKEYAKDYPHILGAAWGYTVEAATQAVRLVLSGALDAYPGIKFILGHFGEGLPFLQWRIDYSFSRPGNKPGLSFRDLFTEHFHVTTSGNFSDTALLCTIQEMGVERILFSIDYPFVPNDRAWVDWIEGVSLSAEDRAKIMGGNAERLLKL
jgi:predicted TIM-barrel fold metal-dependent hydrolase